MIGRETADPMPPLRLYHALAAVPVVGALGGLPLANRVEPRVLGFPFLLVWIVAWIVLTSVVLAVVYRLDERAIARALDAEGAALSPAVKP